MTWLKRLALLQCYHSFLTPVTMEHDYGSLCRPPPPPPTHTVTLHERKLHAHLCLYRNDAVYCCFTRTIKNNRLQSTLNNLYYTKSTLLIIMQMHTHVHPYIWEYICHCDEHFLSPTSLNSNQPCSLRGTSAVLLCSPLSVASP